MMRKLSISCLIILLFSSAGLSQLDIKCSDPVLSLGISPDGKQLLSGYLTSSTDNIGIDLWNVTGEHISTYTSIGSIRHLDFNPGGQSFMSIIENGILITDLNTHAYSYLFHDRVTCADFSPDGKFLVSGSADKTIKFWDLDDKKELQTFQAHDRSIEDVLFAPDGKHFITCSNDNTIKVWDANTMENLRVLHGHTRSVNSITISPDGKLLISGSEDNSCKLWDLNTGNLIRTFYGHTKGVTSVEFSPNGKYLISGSKDNFVNLWEVSTGMKLKNVAVHTGRINDVVFTPDGNSIITCSSDKTIKLWYLGISGVASDNVTTQRGNEQDIALLPTIIWQNPFASNDETSNSDFTLRAYIQSNSPVNDVVIFHNARRIGYTDIENNLIKGANNLDLSLEKEIVLEEGDNQLLILATNSSGSVTSDSRTILYTTTISTNAIGPEVANTISWENPPSSVSRLETRDLQIRACITSGSEIMEISVYLNDELWYLDRGIISDVDSECTVLFENDLNLEPGDNLIRVTAKNRDNETITDSRIIHYSLPTIEKRLALVIGNADYNMGMSLTNPINDAHGMAVVLESVGFEVLSYENADQKTIKKAMDDFGELLEEYDVGLFYYAGHGLQVDGENYLIPTDAVLMKESDVDYDCVAVGRILGKMEDSGSETNIIILDACRDNPFERSWSGRSAKTKGLAFMNAPSGSIIAYATSPGRTAADGEPGRNGLYTEALIQFIQTPGLQIEEVFKNVRSLVEEKTRSLQTPWESTSLKGEFYFIK